PRAVSCGATNCHNQWPCGCNATLKDRIAMESRRNFIGKVATGLAGTLAGSNVLGANDRIRLGVIGLGARGSELLREALGCPSTECAAVADIYRKNLESAAAIAPAAKLYSDYRRLLEDGGVDAVVIATPPHLHAAQFLDALQAGKHIYQERPMAFTLDDAKRMRAAAQRARNLTVQVGHQTCSSGQAGDAVKCLKPELMGKVSAVR